MMIVSSNISSNISSNEKRALDNSSTLMYNLLRKVIGCISDLPSVE